MAAPVHHRVLDMNVDHHRMGAGVALLGLLLLLTLRLWASPVAMIITGRPHVSVTAFLAIPALLVVVGAGIVIFIWGDELGIGRS